MDHSTLQRALGLAAAVVAASWLLLGLALDKGFKMPPLAWQAAGWLTIAVLVSAAGFYAYLGWKLLFGSDDPKVPRGMSYEYRPAAGEGVFENSRRHPGMRYEFGLWHPGAGTVFEVRCNIAPEGKIEIAERMPSSYLAMPTVIGGSLNSRDVRARNRRGRRFWVSLDSRESRLPVLTITVRAAQPIRILRVVPISYLGWRERLEVTLRRLFRRPDDAVEADATEPTQPAPE